MRILHDRWEGVAWCSNFNLKPEVAARMYMTYCALGAVNIKINPVLFCPFLL
jgi:hypothetical protein